MEEEVVQQTSWANLLLSLQINIGISFTAEWWCFCALSKESYGQRSKTRNLKQDFLAGGKGDLQIYHTMYTPTTHSSTTVEFSEPLLCRTIFLPFSQSTFGMVRLLKHTMTPLLIHSIISKTRWVQLPAETSFLQINWLLIHLKFVFGSLAQKAGDRMADARKCMRGFRMGKRAMSIHSEKMLGLPFF